MKPAEQLLVVGALGLGGWWLWNRAQATGQGIVNAIQAIPGELAQAAGQAAQAAGQAAGDALHTAANSPYVQVPDTPILQNDIGSLIEPAVELFTGKPRGIRDNNPTNIEQVGSQVFQGQTGTDGPYLTFDTPVSGIRAAFKIWQTYAASGYTTPATIVPRFSSTAGIDLANYLSTVSAVSGLGPNDYLDTTDPQSMIDFAQGVIAAENGQAWASYYPLSTYQAAWSAI